jgi:tetratricopeptide (TPR) repeat protein
MDLQRLIKSGGFLIISFFITIAVAAPVAGEYLNETVTDTSDPAYWLDQGGLFATYGNFPMAIKAYEKALSLDTNNSEAMFNMGVAYGEMGDTDQALVTINRAISVDPQNDRYYYGRAWVYLRAGQESRAVPDFEKAADLGNLDAIIFLQQ